jgi:opacity protein-like surface antigen
MKASIRVLLPAIALALPMTALPAVAADYEPPIVVDQPQEEVPVEVGSGWYLRGDIGYNVTLDADDPFVYRTFDPTTGIYSGDNFFATADLDKQFTYSIGAGYNFTDWLRADATFDYFTLNFNGTTVSALPCTTNLFYADTTCRSVDDQEGYALSFLANGYVDLGTYVGLTPYVGAGLGVTYVNWDTLNDSTFCVAGVAACPGVTNQVAQTVHDGDDSWRFTYALMAGVAYDLDQDLKLDVGYRYRHIEGGDMFAFDPATIQAGASGVQGKDPGFSSHEVRVGLRYALW